MQAQPPQGQAPQAPGGSMGMTPPSFNPKAIPPNVLAGALQMLQGNNASQIPPA
jgi:hypothetical protein